MIGVPEPRRTCAHFHSRVPRVRIDRISAIVYPSTHKSNKCFLEMNSHMPSHLGFTFDGDGKEYETAPRRPMHAIVASIWYARNARAHAHVCGTRSRVNVRKICEIV